MESTQEHNKAKEWLESFLSMKLQSNPRYSLRAFSQRVGISPSVLSRVLTGKRNLSFKMAVRISDALVLGPIERSELLKMTLKNKDQSPLNEQKKEKHVKDLTIDCFMAMSDWYHYAICQLIYVENFKEDNKWIAKTLGITELEVALAITRLIKLDILDRNDEGALFRTSSHYQTSTDIASAGLRKFQKQILERAILSLSDDLILDRDVTSITMAINIDKIPEAKIKIKQFRSDMADLLEEGVRTRVYNLGVHLVPLSKKV